MIGQIIEIYDDTREVDINTNGVKRYKWTSVMDDDFAKLIPTMWVDFIQVDGFITRINITLNPEDRLANLSQDQRKQLAIVMQSCMKIASEQMNKDGDYENRLETICEGADLLMKFVDSKTLRYLS